MGNDTMDLGQLASLLGRDARELGKLANRGHLPGRKIGGEWRFATAEIHHWLEGQMPALSDAELGALDPTTRTSETPTIAKHLQVECIDLALPARTRQSLLRELVKLAERSNLIWDPAAIRDAVESRERMASTARPEGFAIPHPRRRMPNTLGDSVIALGRTTSGIPFGAEHGVLTDLFFLICCNDDGLHLRIQARLARILRLPDLLDSLRRAETSLEAWEVIDRAERGLSGAGSSAIASAQPTKRRVVVTSRSRKHP
jgi:PTS system nitrogen regulatory IIA component